MKRHLILLVIGVIIGMTLYGCAAIKKANSEITPADVQVQSAQIQQAVTPYVPAPFQPLVPVASGIVGYIVCLIRQVYKDHMAENAALKEKVNSTG